MNPWEQTALDRLRSALRFALWVAVVIHGLMLAVFSVLFTSQFLRHLWSWCQRHLFGSDW